MIKENPSIYNSISIYNGGGGGGGGNSPVYTEDIEVLLNGIIETEQPSSGTVSASIDNTFPIENLKVYSSENITSSGVEFSGLIPSSNEFTLDFFFKGISHNRQITPFFIGFKESYAFLQTNYNDDITNFFWDLFQIDYGIRYQMEKGIWHHVAIENRPVNSTKDERWFFIDGVLKSHYDNYPTVDFSSQTLQFGAGYPKTLYELGQICIRSKVVWTENFNPPDRAYSLY